MLNHKLVDGLCLLLCTLLILSACSPSPASGDTFPGAVAPESEMTVESSKTGVSEFLAKSGGFTTAYTEDECYNITPDFIAERSEFEIFKFDKSTDSFIRYGDEILSIGTCFGGYGITSMALADLNRDGQYELYYTFSWGSGLHRSQIGYFDPVSKEVTIFDYSLQDHDMMLTVNGSGELCVSSASLDLSSFVDFSVRAQDSIGSISLEGEQITLNIS